MAQKPTSDTMEINSILEEARMRNNSLSASKKPAVRNAAPAAQKSAASGAKSAPKKTTAASPRKKTVDDGYVDISSGSYNKNQKNAKAEPKKSKKPLVITIVVLLVLALAGTGGFLWYRYQSSGSSTVVSDKVTVNGVAIGGMTIDEAKKVMTGVEEKLADGIKVHIKADNKDYNLTKDDFSYSFNTDKVLDQIKAYSEEKSLSKDAKDFEIKLTVDTSNTQEIVDKIGQEIHANPRNARVATFDADADNMFTYDVEVVGKDVDTADLVNKVNALFTSGKNAGEVEATVNSVAPKLTVDYLKGHIVKLSSFSTISTNNANGNENMRVSLAACNSSIIEPGETWSFNECTGDSNDPDNGYKPAGVIVQGRSETGIGGGICQSSTTIYNAAILCGMDIVERACHYYKSTYVDAGRDATIDYGNIDLKLENPFKYQLFMKCWMDGTELNCEIYGLQNSKFDEIEISTSDPDYFSTGYTVKAWRTYYKNGKEVDEDDLPSSTYYTVAPKSNSNDDRDYDDDDDDDDDDDEDENTSSSSDDSSSDDSGNADAGNSDAGNADSGNADAGNADSGNADAGNADAGNADAGANEGDGGETPNEG